MKINMSDKFGRCVIGRAKRLDFKKVYEILGNSGFILAGGALQKETPNDFDIYPLVGTFDNDEIVKAVKVKSIGEIAFESRNAVTVSICNKNGNKELLQFCNYSKPTPEELINSFDFAHCQICVVFNGNGEEPKDVYCSDDYLMSKLNESMFYTGSEYPTASLVRLVKYAKRNMFSKKSYVEDIFKILTNIVERGYESYDDFKDQMDAIDLGLSGYCECYKFYQSCKQKGLSK